MSDAEFRMLTELFRSHCGLHFGSESRYLLERRLGRRLLELGLRSFTSYHYTLRSDTSGEGELAWAIDHLTTNETYFLRERQQLEALVQEILPSLQARRGGREGGAVSIWCAGCSSGEEPYSIVMLAAEAGLEPGRDLRVYASDISRQMLHKARRGLYREASFRQTEPWLRQKYFVEKDGQFRIADEVKRHVNFAHLNLLDEKRIALLGVLDVVLCRNVIIYFDLETKRRVVGTFHDKLRPGGYLLLGHSESLINLSTDFALEHLRHDMVYRRPAESDPWHETAERTLLAVDRGPR
ncbi:MAG: protein-glutamate O-methyltransferase CheR [Deltaproteobacteria bacterium]|nr:protein-glutamate O-methyltransferase CheR [Deltaproteobacteria bacterium]